MMKTVSHKMSTSWTSTLSSGPTYKPGYVYIPLVTSQCLLTETASFYIKWSGNCWLVQDCVASIHQSQAGILYGLRQVLSKLQD